MASSIIPGLFLVFLRAASSKNANLVAQEKTDERWSNKNAVIRHRQGTRRVTVYNVIVGAFLFHFELMVWNLLLYVSVIVYQQHSCVRLITMSKGSHRVEERIRLVSRLVENVLKVEWILENLERYESRVAGLTFESPVFGPTQGAFKWQLVMSVRDACSSSLALQLHPSSLKRPRIEYRYGIANTNGDLEFENHGQMNFGLDAPQQHPSILFSWARLMEMKQNLFVKDQLRIECQITMLDCENVVDWTRVGGCITKMF